VGIFMPNIPQFVVAYFGILKAGGTVVAVNPTYPVDEIIMPANDANIEIMFTMSRFYDKVKAAREKSKIKRIIVTNIKESLPPITRLLFTLLKEKKRRRSCGCAGKRRRVDERPAREARELTQAKSGCWPR